MSPYQLIVRTGNQCILKSPQDPTQKEYIFAPLCLLQESRELSKNINYFRWVLRKVSQILLGLYLSRKIVSKDQEL